MAVTFIGSAFWMLACMVVGVRAALDYKSLGRALSVVIIAWIFQAILLFLILILFKNFKSEKLFLKDCSYYKFCIHV